MSNEIKKINNEILRITQNVVVHAPNYSKFGGYDGERDIYTMDIAKALYNTGYRKQSEVVKEFVKRFEYHLKDATFTLGQTNDIQYALKKATEEMKGGAE